MPIYIVPIWGCLLTRKKKWAWSSGTEDSYECQNIYYHVIPSSQGNITHTLKRRLYTDKDANAECYDAYGYFVMILSALDMNFCGFTPFCKLPDCSEWHCIV